MTSPLDHTKPAQFHWVVRLGWFGPNRVDNPGGGATIMSQSPTDSVSRPTGRGPITDAEFHELRSSDRRRALLEVLAEEPRPVDLRTIAAAVSGRESGIDSADPDSIDQVALTLHHVHLPLLADIDVVDYDAAANSVETNDSELLR